MLQTHFPFCKLATEFWGMLDRSEMNTVQPGNKMGVSRWFFKDHWLHFTPTPCHTTMAYHIPLRTKKETLFYFLKKSINSTPPATLSPVSGTAANNKLCKATIRVWKRNDKKRMKGMGPSVVTCSPSALHLFSVQRTASKIKSPNTL